MHRRHRSDRSGAAGQKPPEKPDRREFVQHARQCHLVLLATTIAVTVFSLFQNTTRLERARGELEILRSLTTHIEREFVEAFPQTATREGANRDGTILWDHSRALSFSHMIGSERAGGLPLQFSPRHTAVLHALPEALSAEGIFGPRIPPKTKTVKWSGVVVTSITQPRSLSEVIDLWNQLLNVTEASSLRAVFLEKPIAVRRFDGTAEIVGGRGGEKSINSSVTLMELLPGTPIVLLPDSPPPAVFSMLPVWHDFSRIQHISEVASNYSDDGKGYLFDNALNVFVAESRSISHFALSSRPTVNLLDDINAEPFRKDYPSGFPAGTEFMIRGFERLLSVSVYSTKVDPLGVLLTRATGTVQADIPRGAFSAAFPALNEEFGTIDSLSLEQIQNEISRRLAETGGTVEIAGLSFPAAALRSASVLIILAVLLYFVLHFGRLVDVLPRGDPAWEAPWIALHRDRLSRIAFSAVSVFAPPVSALIVVTQSFTAMSGKLQISRSSVIFAVNAIGLVSICLLAWRVRTLARTARQCADVSIRHDVSELAT